MDLQQLVAETDTGGRKVAGVPGQLIFWVAVGWSIFQLWYASPLPFTLGFGILNDTEARSLHLAIGMFLASAVLLLAFVIVESRSIPERARGASSGAP